MLAYLASLCSRARAEERRATAKLAVDRALELRVGVIRGMGRLPHRTIRERVAAARELEAFALRLMGN
jgi:hypothetical protein